jgi:F-type H+-transporting ATPase subunit a
LTFSALLQTFVFMILTYVYLAGAVAVEEGHEEEAPDPVVDTMGAV